MEIQYSLYSKLFLFVLEQYNNLGHFIYGTFWMASSLWGTKTCYLTMLYKLLGWSIILKKCVFLAVFWVIEVNAKGGTFSPYAIMVRENARSSNSTQLRSLWVVCTRNWSGCVETHNQVVSVGSFCPVVAHGMPVASRWFARIPHTSASTKWVVCLSRVVFVPRPIYVCHLYLFF